MMPVIKEDLAALNIRHDVFFSEASLTKGGADKIKTAIDALRAMGLIYEGRLEKPKGHEDEGVGGARADAVQVDRVRR